MKYLVMATEGPGFASPEEAVELLETEVLPTFDELIRLEEGKKILAGGLPVGERAFVCIMDAASNEELDDILRDLPLWGSLEWEVTPLQSFANRASKESEFVKAFKKRQEIQ
jgi:muconolactone delta-isomerase